MNKSQFIHLGVFKGRYELILGHPSLISPMVSVDVKHHVYFLILGCLKADNNKQSNQFEMNTLSPKKSETCAKKTHVPELITVPVLYPLYFLIIAFIHSLCCHDHCFQWFLGMTEKVVATLLKKHEAEKEGLRNTHEKNRRNQDEKLKVRTPGILTTWRVMWL